MDAVVKFFVLLATLGGTLSHVVFTASALVRWMQEAPDLPQRTLLEVLLVLGGIFEVLAAMSLLLSAGRAELAPFAICATLAQAFLIAVVNSVARITDVYCETGANAVAMCVLAAIVWQWERVLLWNTRAQRWKARNAAALCAAALCRNAEPPESACAICIGTSEGARGTLPCGHAYHMQCIQRWWVTETPDRQSGKQPLSCPVCRQSARPTRELPSSWRFWARLLTVSRSPAVLTVGASGQQPRPGTERV